MSNGRSFLLAHESWRSDGKASHNVACCTTGSGPEGSTPIRVLYLRTKEYGIRQGFQEETADYHKLQGQPIIDGSLMNHCKWQGARSPTCCSCLSRHHGSCPNPRPIAQFQLRKPKHQNWLCTSANSNNWGVFCVCYILLSVVSGTEIEWNWVNGATSKRRAAQLHRPTLV